MYIRAVEMAKTAVKMVGTAVEMVRTVTKIENFKNQERNDSSLKVLLKVSNHQVCQKIVLLFFAPFLVQFFKSCNSGTPLPGIR